APREIETTGGRANRDDGAGAGDARQRDQTETDRPRSLNDDRIAQLNRRPLDAVYGGEQAAPAADVVLEPDRCRQLRHDDARLEIDRLRPPAEEAFVR